MTEPRIHHATGWATTIVLAGLVWCMSAASMTGALGGTVDRARVTARATNDRVDINQADAATLSLLPGIGPGIGARIVAHRREHGPFAGVDELTSVSGVGPATLQRVRPWVVCGRERR